jgi:multiple sugar transport system ATP-binding protein
MAELTLQGLGKRFGAVDVFRNISLEVEDGEFVVLVGPSGCGKSTLLRTIAGLEEISEGHLLIDGKRANELPPKTRDIAMVFQNYALYPHLTVEDNMGFSLRLAGVPTPQIRSKVQDVARSLRLETLLHRRPKELSGGQRQRVAMGRALVRAPKVFLFDEPLSNLDAKLRTQMRGEIKEMQARVRTTTVYVTHDQVEAMTMADRIVVMNGGRVEQIGAPMDLYERPDNLFVAAFIGSPAMNLVPGQVSTEGGRRVVLTDAGAKLNCHSEVPALDGTRVVCGIRPEHLDITEDGIPVTLRAIEPMGSETHLSAWLGEMPLTLIVRERCVAKVGDVLRVAPRTAHLHLFDEASGAALRH